ncbi:MCE family protein [Nocardioides lianchengensis]|uniref:Phospholipid/cholesterol/gamma-HCH transport system substrate-binding protein n=1 Tax=Nocardioides lianchengensis TaxID=1045774 RepID=A0A1G7B658_9ACTN|nr:MCE family protein [Nocardioides lianchengensis]NYG10099.1 phospholipid/cholesterol/gamma-HCH transport system substrate-binding protein [Nocardioides lianchengensis]SDE22604.1 phospholipid/cholesterol/gamma-HCH transport system substrate-binding protein [Nocardioides lianchengensis]
MSTAVRRTAARWTAALGLAALLTGCGLGNDLYETPLPGGADVGSDPVRITADFQDAVDLVPQSSVKVENIAVGRVQSIDLNPDGRTARVTLLVRRDVDLPTGTTARLQQTSLLGEKYVALVRPEEGKEGPGSLSTGANIPIADTSQVAEVEQVLGALSLVVNGGGLGRFQEISRELQQVSAGRPEEIRGFLRNMETFMSSLDSRKGALTAALDSLASLSETLETDRDKIATALDGLSPGLQVLVDQREQLVEMLGSLDRLSDVTLRTLDASQQDMVEDLELLEPILRELAESGSALPNSLELLLTYPFPDAVLGAIKGDYLNVFATANYTSLPASCRGLGCPWPQLDDPGAMPPIDPFDPDAGRSAPMTLPSASGSPSASASTSSSPSGGPSASGSPSGSGSPSASASPSASGSASVSPSPSLLPPTDSALPGLPEPSVQVPTAAASSSESATPGEED